jgi:hypothetical protein
MTTQRIFLWQQRGGEDGMARHEMATGTTAMPSAS